VQLPQQRKSPGNGWHGPVSGFASLKNTARTQSQNTTPSSANDLISDEAFRINHNTFTINYIKSFSPKGSETHPKEILTY